MSELLDYLMTLRNESVYYIPNPGNSGDSLIAAGTFQTFRRLGLKIKTPNPQKANFSHKVVIYGGGGNLVSPHSFSTKLLTKVHSLAKKLVVLPHTIKDIDLLLEAFGSNVDIWCRERVSYDYAKATAINANVNLANDMAFSLRPEDLLSLPEHGLPIRLPRYLVDRYIAGNATISGRNLLRSWDIKDIVAGIKKKAVGDVIYCYRTDGESSGDYKLPTENVDLSEILTFGVENESAAFFTTYHLLNVLNQYKAIHTDRLHLAIGSALLGKEVFFYPNSYYKCREIYKYSIKDKYPSVRWMGGV